jgi:peroxiredoxin
MELQEQLDALRGERLTTMPLEATLVERRAIERLAASGLAQRAIQAGESAPAFRLRDGKGKAFSSTDALRAGPLLILFYRGRWCSYCNLELRAIQSASNAIRSFGATVVAVSQQVPAESVETERLNGLSFPSLVDISGRVAHSFGLRWKASAELRAMQESRGTDLAAFNGDSSWTLTMPARYLVGQSGVVEYADVSVDHTRRGNPSDLIPVFERLRARTSS